MGVLFISWHCARAAVSLLTNEALDCRAKIPEFKAGAVQVFAARGEQLPHPEAVVQRMRQ